MIDSAIIPPKLLKILHSSFVYKVILFIQGRKQFKKGFFTILLCTSVNS